MDKSVIKYSIITIFKGLVVILAFLFILTKCTSCGGEVKIVKSDNSMLYEKIKQDSLKFIDLEVKLKASEDRTIKVDSVRLKAEKDYRISVNSLKKRLRMNLCDTIEIITVLNECDSVIESNHTSIAQRDSSISILQKEKKVQSDMLEASRIIIKNQNNDILVLEEIIKKQEKKLKRRTFWLIFGDAVKDALLIFALK